MSAPKLLWVTVYAAAMAYVEAAVVLYLRLLYGIGDLILDAPTRPDPVVWVEVGREASTLVMLLAVGQVAGATRAARWGWFLYAWGAWDVAYYAWLRVLLGWPRSLADWDLLFLIPLPWWGPVWAPVSAALLFMAFGASLARRGEAGRPVRVDGWSALLGSAGALVALWAVLSPALGRIGEGWEAAAAARPQAFPWAAYLAGYAAVAAAAWRVAAGAGGVGLPTVRSERDAKDDSRPTRRGA